MSGRQKRKTARAARTAAKVLPAGFAHVPDAPAQGWDSAAATEAPPLGDAFFAGRASCIQAGTPRPSRGRWKKAPRRETSRHRAELDWLHALSSLEEGRGSGPQGELEEGAQNRASNKPCAGSRKKAHPSRSAAVRPGPDDTRTATLRRGFLHIAAKPVKTLRTKACDGFALSPGRAVLRHYSIYFHLI